MDTTSSNSIPSTVASGSGSSQYNSPTTPIVTLRSDEQYLPPFIPNAGRVTPSSSNSFTGIQIARPPRSSRPSSVRGNTRSTVPVNITSPTRTTSVRSPGNSVNSGARVTSPRNAIVSMEEVNALLGNPNVASVASTVGTTTPSSNRTKTPTNVGSTSYDVSGISVPFNFSDPTTNTLSSVPSVNAPLPQVSNSPVFTPVFTSVQPQPLNLSNPAPPTPPRQFLNSSPTLTPPVFTIPQEVPVHVSQQIRNSSGQQVSPPTSSLMSSQTRNSSGQNVASQVSPHVSQQTRNSSGQQVPTPRRINPPPGSTELQRSGGVQITTSQTSNRIADIRTLSGTSNLISSGTRRTVHSPPAPIIDSVPKTIDGVPVHHVVRSGLQTSQVPHSLTSQVQGLRTSQVQGVPTALSQSQRDRTGPPMSNVDYSTPVSSQPQEYHRITEAQLDLPNQQLPTPESERLRVNMEKTAEAPSSGPVTDPQTGIVIPEGHILVKTDYGMYLVPKYDQMSVEEQRTHWNTFDLRFQLLNQSWRHYGMRFERPQAGETLTNVHVRYKQTIKYIMARSGADMYKIILVLCWLAVEVICCKMRLKASGYTKSQLRMYDIYHTSLIEMGETSGFGEGWAPWVKILVISLVNGAAFVLISTFLGQGNPLITDGIMNLLSQFILGNNVAVTTDNELGVPQPSESGILGALAGMANRAGGTAAPSGEQTQGGEGGEDTPAPNVLTSLLSGLNLQGIDLGGVISQLGTAFTGHIQNNSNQQTPSTTGPVNRSTESADRRRQRRRERRRESSVVIDS